MTENAQPRKCQNGKCATWKMQEQKMHIMENGRKCTGWKIKENTQLENVRMENAQPENDRKFTPLKMIENKYNVYPGEC